MVHRNIFPLGKKSVEIKKELLLSQSMHQMESRDTDSFSFSLSQKEILEEEKARHYEAKLQNEIISAIKNTTDMYVRWVSFPA